jgi:hypothetical protein
VYDSLDANCRFDLPSRWFANIKRRALYCKRELRSLGKKRRLTSCGLNSQTQCHCGCPSPTTKIRHCLRHHTGNRIPPYLIDYGMPCKRPSFSNFHLTSSNSASQTIQEYSTCEARVENYRDGISILSNPNSWSRKWNHGRVTRIPYSASPAVRSKETPLQKEGHVNICISNM